MRVIGSEGRGNVGAAVLGAGVGVSVAVGAGLGVGAWVGAAVCGAGVNEVGRDALGEADGDGLADGAASR